MYEILSLFFDLRFFPLIFIVPLHLRSKPHKHLANVDLPAPLSPIIAIISFLGI